MLRARFGFVIMLASALLSACGGEAEHTHARAPNVVPPSPADAQLATAARPPTERPKLGRRAKLVFALPDGRPFPLPLVRGTILGEPTWMIVDSGANMHMITGWLAKKVGAVRGKTGDATDHVGKSIATYRIEHAKMTIDGWGALEDTPILAIDVPEGIERLGIGGFISPQRLVEEGDSVLLDLQANEMASAYWDEATLALTAGGKSLAPIGARACRDDEAKAGGVSFVLHASVDGEDMELLLDTGAERTDVLAETGPGRALAPFSVPSSEKVYAASGKISPRVIKEAKISVGEVSITANVDLVPGSPDASCPRDGVLSMDALRGCALLLGRTKMLGRCE